MHSFLLNGSSVIFGFFICSLESTMSQFTWCINEFQLNLFSCISSNSCHQTLSQNQNSFFRSNAASFDNDEIISNCSIMREPSQRSDFFICQISLSRSISGILGISNSVNFFINFCSMVITMLTSSGDSKSNSSWMPCSYTSYSSVTSMSFFL